MYSLSPQLRSHGCEVYLHYFVADFVWKNRPDLGIIPQDQHKYLKDGGISITKQYDSLKKRAERLGIPINSGIYKPKDQAWNELNITEYELHRRINEEKRHRREHRLFWIAIMSMIISLISASAAWYLAVEKSTN